MTYEDPAARDAYRRGASEAFDCFYGHLPPAKVRELQEWLRDLTAWEGGTPPLSPHNWEAGRPPEG